MEFGHNRTKKRYPTTYQQRLHYARFPPSVAVSQLQFRRSAVVKFRCNSVKLRKKIAAVNGKKLP